MRDTLRVAEERLGLALLATNESVWDWNIKTGADLPRPPLVRAHRA